MYEYITKTIKLLSKDYFCVIVSKRLEHTDNVKMLLKMKTTAGYTIIKAKNNKNHIRSIK